MAMRTDEERRKERSSGPMKTTQPIESHASFGLVYTSGDRCVPSSQTQARLMPVPEKIVKYQLEHELGHGGMGSVWSAYDPELERRVAIKLIRHFDDATLRTVERFRREARAIARLNSQHVVQIYDYGVTADDTPYIVMELLRGETLADCLQRSQRMAPEAFLPIFNQITKGLQTAHDAGIVHRDLKPANIFLHRHSDEPIVKILDFGLASLHPERAEHGRLTSDNQLLGTPQYMSPEQTRALVVDHRSDLWSAGVIAYRALTGVAPFEASQLTAILMKICLEQPIMPSVLHPALGNRFDEFFTRALHKKALARFASAREMRNAFAHLVPRRTLDLRCKILVVDDEVDIPLLIEQCFHKQVRAGRYEFVFANDGKAGLQRLGEQRDIDVVLTDINMPGMDGLTFLNRLKQSNPVVESIMITAYGDMSNIRSAMNYGAFDFLVKPLDFQDLEATIEKAARCVRERRSALRSLEENEALRTLVDPVVMEHLVHVQGTVTGTDGQVFEGAAIYVELLGAHDHAANADTSEVIDTLNRHFDIVAAAIDRAGGMIVRFFGNAMLGVFHSAEHIARAVSAAIDARTRLLHTLDATSVGLQVRIGMDAGYIVAGRIGAPSRHRFDYAMFGVPVDNARRLAEQGKHGRIRICSAIHDEISGRHICELDGELDTPGDDTGSSPVFYIVGDADVGPMAFSDTEIIASDF